MRIRWLFSTVLAVVLLSPIDVGAKKDLHSDLDLDDAEKAAVKKISVSLKIEDDAARNKTDKAMRLPEKRERLGQVIPIIRSMSPPQKMAMGSLISTRISNNDTDSSPLEEVRSLFGDGNRENATSELLLPISMDIAKILSEDPTDEEETPEELPEAQELKFVRSGARRRPIYRLPPPRRPLTLNRRNVYTESSRKPGTRPSRRPTETRRGPSEKECTFFTKTVCLEAVDYPHEAITRSLKTNKEMVSALLTDYKAQDNTGNDDGLPLALPLENKFENKYHNRYENRYESRYENNEIKRRSDFRASFDNVEEGFTCPSIVKYARPQLARAASGIWKYIINTGEHTQTLRLEKCSNPQSSCSFISENYRSSCVQVYNYHRLLTWDNKLGLHMDIFKVPTCCSCHVHGYSDLFPPHQNDPPPKPKESFPGADFATTNDHKEELQDLGRPAGGYVNKFNPGYDSSLVSSNKKPVLDRPSFPIPGRTRQKKPPPAVPRPFEKLPQQHAPNTRAPGYTGPLPKGARPNSSRPGRPPFRRESTSHFDDVYESTTNSTIGTRYSQPYDQDMDATSRLQNGGFDDEYQEPQKRINYNYHPIIDFFKPEASMLQSTEPQLATQPAPVQSDSNSWKPVISS
ncbi:hypothetical protein KM043_014803 [Ampulex compressa]|nr:hypothetical protein KM043_014803 [Ampulex compressa]